MSKINMSKTNNDNKNKNKYINLKVYVSGLKNKQNNIKNIKNTENIVCGKLEFVKTKDGWMDREYDKDNNSLLLGKYVNNLYYNNETIYDIIDWLNCEFEKVEIISKEKKCKE